MDRDALELLAKSSIRRLVWQRHGRNGADARQAIRQWLETLRGLKAATPC